MSEGTTCVDSGTKEESLLCAESPGTDLPPEARWKVKVARMNGGSSVFLRSVSRHSLTTGSAPLLLFRLWLPRVGPAGPRGCKRTQ